MAARRTRACAPEEHARRASLRDYDDATYARAAEILLAASNPARLRLLVRLLHGEKSVGELAVLTLVELSVVSKQLRVLRLAGLIATSRVGRVVFCRLANDGVRRLLRRALSFNA